MLFQELASGRWMLLRLLLWIENAIDANSRWCDNWRGRIHYTKYTVTEYHYHFHSLYLPHYLLLAYICVIDIALAHKTMQMSNGMHWGILTVYECMSCAWPRNKSTKRFSLKHWHCRTMIRNCWMRLQLLRILNDLVLF